MPLKRKTEDFRGILRYPVVLCKELTVEIGDTAYCPEVAVLADVAGPDFGMLR